jgi:methyl-accepting chemotaxis protein
MRWLESLQVRTRLFVLLLVMSAILVAVGVEGGLQLAREAEIAEKGLGADVSAMRIVSDIRAGVANARRFEKDQFLNMGNEEQTARYRKQWAAEVDGLLAQLNSAPTTMPHMAHGLAALREAVGRYRRGVMELNGRIDRGEVNDPWAANAAMEPLKGDIRAADKALGELVTQVEGRAKQSQVDMVARTRQAHLLIAAATCLAVLVGGFLTAFVSRTITRPLDALQRISATWASGDLRAALQPRGNDEIARTQRHLNEMRASLVTLLQQVSHTAESISSASGEIATGTEDLSRRTGEAAGSLQMTAASMEQLFSSARDAAKSAEGASGMALSARKSASQGGETVDAVVETMEGISSSARKIAEIITVIDSIAFQTNILALNAAVEAARAGEQGRGFGVVASEVRGLASRCAEAAKQVRALISSSVDQVQAGTTLVAQAGQTMETLVVEVQRVSEVIGRISTVAAEQSASLAAVNGAVASIDRMTQQNAALVEQSSAATASLNEQAMALNVSLARFKFATA